MTVYRFGPDSGPIVKEVTLVLKKTGASPLFRTSGQLEGSNGKFTRPFHPVQLHEGPWAAFRLMAPAGHHSNATSNSGSGRSCRKRPSSISQIVFWILESFSAGKLGSEDTWLVVSVLYFLNASNQPLSSLKSSLVNGLSSSPAIELMEADRDLFRCVVHFPADFEVEERIEREVEVLRDLVGSNGESNPEELPVDGR